MLHGDVMEDYPEDVRGHSCSMVGQLQSGRIVHVVCSPKADYLAHRVGGNWTPTEEGETRPCFHCQAELHCGTAIFTDSRTGYVLVLLDAPAWGRPQCREPLFEAAAVNGIQEVLQTLDDRVQKLYQAA